MGLESEEKVEIDPKVKADRVRRNLFGPVDHEQLQEDFQRLLWTSIEVARQKWNFDFIREIPSAGTLEWEELSCQDVPAFYRSCVIRGRKHLQGLQGATLQNSSCSQQPEVQAQERKTQGTPQPKKRRQTCMTGI
uniref:Cyclin-dependent kinase inhibitor 1-like protein n=1 Tax=Callorhinchus milii TaxID=7868 RepID=V9L9R7_CALMI